MKEKIIFSLDEVSKIAAELWSLRNTYQLFTFTGPLGAGKTTLVKEILKQAGVKEVTTSPTFTYVNVYKVNGHTLYHFDLYRIHSLDEFLQQGFDEYLYAPQSWSFIEWPEVIEPLLKKNVCHISLDYHGSDKRELTFKTKEKAG
jgi:tRNA threonylcarbamoyladenosine biosynthesis protein TsaE